MKRAAVLLGVNRVSGVIDLPMLNDAVGAASRMCNWLIKVQKVDPNFVIPITDSKRPVTVERLQKAIDFLLEPMKGVEQLLIYFSGHGLNISYGEYWLLSEALRYPNESVNVNDSAVLARYCSIPHVIFISDACRTAAEGVQQQWITGSPIFPMALYNGPEKAVDQFFACTLGDPALEARNQNAGNAGAFTALYTDALLDLLEGGDPSIVEIAHDGIVPNGVIRPWPLKGALCSKVSSSILSLNLQNRVYQTPDARICSDPQRAWISRLPAPLHPLLSPPLKIKPILGSRNQSVLGLMQSNIFNGGVHYSVLSIPDQVNALLNYMLDKSRSMPESEDLRDIVDILEDASRQSMAFEPLYFEIDCGVRLSGRKAVHAFCPDTKVEWVVEGEILRAYPHPAQISDWVLLVFDDYSGAMVPLRPNFIAELSFDEGEWVGLAYEASENSPNYEPDPELRAHLRFLREFVVAAVKRGVFQPERDTLVVLTNYLLSARASDPMLLLYLAYALDDAGMVSLLRDWVAFIRDRGEMPFFDVALLAYRPGEEQDGLRACTPGLPLLARSWSGLDARGVKLPNELVNISRMRHPGLWSHFTSDAVEIILKEFSFQDNYDVFPRLDL